MRAKESPADANGGAGIQAGQPGLFVVPNSKAAPTTPAGQLAAWVDDLLEGTVSLAVLPAPVVELYLLGHLHGAQSRDDEIFRLHVENDLLHWRAYNPGRTAADYRRAQTDALWAEGVAA